MLRDKLHLLKKRPSRVVCEENTYERIRLIGQGTFGKVYLVVNRKNQEQMALKEVLQDSKYKNRELSIISQLDHQNVIEMKDYFFTMNENKCVLHILMDYMDTSLHNLLKHHRPNKLPLPIAHRKIIAFQLFKGLYYLSTNNICHRDLKPPNILLNTDTLQLKICDFGSAKIIENKENNVSYICSRYYRAPELILNSTSYACEIDMWSAGCILVELMTLEPVFPGDSSIEQLIQIIKILGTPSKAQMEKFSVENSKVSLPSLKGNDWKKVLKRYNPPEEELDLIRKILTYDIEARLKPYEALKHPYFADLISFEESRQLPDLLDFESLRNKKNKRLIGELEELFENYNGKHEHKGVEDTAQTMYRSKNI